MWYVKKPLGVKRLISTGFTKNLSFEIVLVWQVLNGMKCRIICNFVRCAVQSRSHQHGTAIPPPPPPRRLRKSLSSSCLVTSHNFTIHIIKYMYIRGNPVEIQTTTQWNLNGCSSFGIAQQYSSAAIFSLHVCAFKEKPARVLKMLLFAFCPFFFNCECLNLSNVKMPTPGLSVWNTTKWWSVPLKNAE